MVSWQCSQNSWAFPESCTANECQSQVLEQWRSIGKLTTPQWRWVSAPYVWVSTQDDHDDMVRINLDLFMQHNFSLCQECNKWQMLSCYEVLLWPCGCLGRLCLHPPARIQPCSNAPKLCVSVSTWEQSQWCSQNLYRPLLSSQTLII